MTQKLTIGKKEYLVLTDDDIRLYNKPYFVHGVHHHIEEAQPLYDEISMWPGQILIISSRSMAGTFMSSELWDRVKDTLNCFVLKEHGEHGFFEYNPLGVDDK